MAEPADRVVIVGAGGTAESAPRYLAAPPNAARIVGFVDDHNFTFGEIEHGRPILGSIEDLEVIHARTWFNESFVVEKLTDDRMAESFKIVIRHQIGVRRFSIDLSEVVQASPSRSALSPFFSLARITAAIDFVQVKLISGRRNVSAGSI